jgi:hypothetical protein
MYRNDKPGIANLGMVTAAENACLAYCPCNNGLGGVRPAVTGYEGSVVVVPSGSISLFLGAGTPRATASSPLFSRLVNHVPA